MIDFLQKRLRPLTLAICLGIGGLILPQTASAQDSEEDLEDLINLKELLEELQEELGDEFEDSMEEIAEEYIDILDQLSDIIDDYSDYFEETDEDYYESRNINFNLFYRKIERGKYVDNPRELQSDIRQFAIRIKKIESDHDHSRDCRSQCRVLRNLEREISILNDHIDDYLTKSTERQLQLKEMRIYLHNKMPKLIEDVLKVSAVELASAAEALKRLQAGLEGNGIESVPPVASLPTRRNPVVGIGVAPRADHDNIGAGSFRSYEDSLPVSVGEDPVWVSSPVGDVRITGWDRSVITASLQIQVKSHNRSREELFLDRVGLHFDMTTRGYELSVNLPPLNNSAERLLESTLIVRVPRSKTIIGSSSHGKISVADFVGSVTVSGNHSEINIDKVGGKAVAKSSMGTIRITDVQGAVEVDCSHGQIELNNCGGGIQIDKVYSGLEMYDCGGSAYIRGSGTIFVQGFRGPLDISNSYGAVEIRDVNGSLEAINAYDALVVRNVTGKVDLENSYSSITAYRIGSNLTISNTDGLIFVEAIDGSLDIENEGGDIKLIVDRSLGGTSTIMNTRGSIDLAILRRGDLVVDVRTIDGDINSHLPLILGRRGDTQTALISFGRGLDSLILLGDAAVINISESD